MRGNLYPGAACRSRQSLWPACRQSYERQTNLRGSAVAKKPKKQGHWAEGGALSCGLERKKAGQTVCVCVVGVVACTVLSWCCAVLSRDRCSCLVPRSLDWTPRQDMRLNSLYGSTIVVAAANGFTWLGFRVASLVCVYACLLSWEWSPSSHNSAVKRANGGPRMHTINGPGCD